MKNVTRNVLLMVFPVFLTVAPIHVQALDVKPGMWEWTTTMDMPGMPFKMPPTVHRSCVNEDDLTPKKPDDDQSCKMTEYTMTDNGVHWIIECTGKSRGVSVGDMTYNGDTARGIVKISTQGMEIVSKVSGRRTGKCN